jgi:hypothetical protein
MRRPGSLETEFALDRASSVVARSPDRDTSATAGLRFGAKETFGQRLCGVRRAAHNCGGAQLTRDEWAADGTRPSALRLRLEESVPATLSRRAGEPLRGGIAWLLVPQQKLEKIDQLLFRELLLQALGHQ